MDWLRKLRIDLDILEHFKYENNEEKVNEYKALVISHVQIILKKMIIGRLLYSKIYGINKIKAELSN